MLGLELVVILGVALLIAHTAARRLRIAPPVLLLATGLLLGFVPALRRVYLPPDAVLLIFLPVLLYWEALTTSLREIRSNLRAIISLSTVLVVLTAWAVAAVAHGLGMPWGPAWVLGAALAPTDATAVGQLARALPHRNVTLLRAESLANDGTALVVYGVAVGSTIGEQHMSVPHVSLLFAISYGGGLAIGAAVAWAGFRIRRLLTDPLLENTAIITIAFAAYLIAELAHASGVLAVVVCGLMMSQAGPNVGQAAGRLQTEAFWSLATFMLNGALFVLVGMYAHAAARQLTGTDLVTAAIIVGAVAATVVGVRFTWLFTAPYLVRLIDRRPQQRLRRMGPRPRIVMAAAGFRGAVSLALALSVPVTLDSGAPFPNRDTIVFVTSGVILITLVVQGLALPAVVSWAKLPQDDLLSQELGLAQSHATELALKTLPRLAADLGTDRDVADRVEEEFTQHLAFVRAHGGESEGDPAVRHTEQYTALRLAAINHKRATILGLRDEHRIDDTVLRRLQAALDIEEMRLVRIDEVE